MSRFKKAWLALTGRLEPEVREVVKEVVVLGTPEPCDLYVVAGPTGVIQMHNAYDVSFPFPQTRKKYYATCEQAHKENPGAGVSKERFWRIGNLYLAGLSVREVTLQPKPERAKGR